MNFLHYFLCIVKTSQNQLSILIRVGKPLLEDHLEILHLSLFNFYFVCQIWFAMLSVSRTKCYVLLDSFTSNIHLPFTLSSIISYLNLFLRYIMRTISLSNSWWHSLDMFEFFISNVDCKHLNLNTPIFILLYTFQN